MNFSVIPSDKFKKEAKRLIKKFPSLKQELTDLNAILEKAPETGTSLGNDTYKIRIAIKSKGKGKSGGARVITYVVTDNKEVYLLTIYDKSEFDSVDDKTLKNIIGTLNSDE
jgi:mRNA-degrading endonuclease RelE of RelBE toxin-antitoxin system